MTGKIGRGPLHFAAAWKVAQRMTRRPVKFGAISATCLPMMLWNEHYPSHRALVLDLAAALNGELRELGLPEAEILAADPRFAFTPSARAGG